MTRIASDSVALAADGIACMIYDDPAGQRSPTAFDPRRPISGLAQRLLLASNALNQGCRLWPGSGGAFSEPGTTRHARSQP